MPYNVDTRPLSSADRALASGARGGGSTPSGGTTHRRLRAPHTALAGRGRAVVVFPGGSGSRQEEGNVRVRAGPRSSAPRPAAPGRWLPRAWFAAAGPGWRGCLPARLLQRYLDANLPTWAAAVAFHAFFALFPLLLSLLTLAGLALRDPARLEVLARVLAGLFPPDAATPLLDVLRSSSEHPGLLGALSALGLLYSGAALFGTLENAFNQVYGLRNRGLVHGKLLALAMLVLLTLLVLLALLVTSAAALLQALAGQLAHQLVWPPAVALLATLRRLSGLAALALVAAGLALLYLLWYALLPNRPPDFWHTWPGALLATALTLATSQLFPLYLDWIGRYSRYGAAFGLPLLLLTWLYFLAHIVLLGATLNALVEEAAPPRRLAPAAVGV
jgi:membrane protein